MPTSKNSNPLAPRVWAAEHYRALDQGGIYTSSIECSAPAATATHYIRSVRHYARHGGTFATRPSNTVYARLQLRRDKTLSRPPHTLAPCRLPQHTRRLRSIRDELPVLSPGSASPSSHHSAVVHALCTNSQEKSSGADDDDDDDRSFSVDPNDPQVDQRRSILYFDNEALQVHNRVIVGRNNIISGNNNLVIGDDCHVFGNSNRVRGERNRVRGYACTSIAYGNGGSVRGGGSVIIRVSANVYRRRRHRKHKERPINLSMSAQRIVHAQPAERHLPRNKSTPRAKERKSLLAQLENKSQHHRRTRKVKK